MKGHSKMNKRFKISFDGEFRSGLSRPNVMRGHVPTEKMSQIHLIFFT